MIHLVFNTADVASIEEAIALDDSLAGKVVEIKDDYAVGPILDIYETEGYQARRDWWKNVLEHYLRALEKERTRWFRRLVRGFVVSCSTPL
jgi:hypothetical protein